MSIRLTSLPGLLLAFALIGSANAATIRSPLLVLQNTAGNESPAASIDSTIDRSGLSTTFVSGVTNFATYMAGAPTHSFIYTDGAEWFSLQGQTTGIVDYDLGGIFRISQMALWNEEFSGIETLSVRTSNDPTFGTSTIVGIFNPIDNPFGADYGAEVFSLLTSDARYVRFDITGPQTPNLGIYLSMGEVAFATDDPTVVPVPATLPLLLAGLVSLSTFASRSRKRKPLDA
jgi:hypothetical protein